MLKNKTTTSQHSWNNSSNQGNHELISNTLNSSVCKCCITTLQHIQTTETNTATHTETTETLT